MNNNGALKEYATEDFNASRREWELLNQELVSKQINVGVLIFINEIELSIYRFLALGAKISKNSLDWSSCKSSDWLAIGQLMHDRWLISLD